MLSGWRRGGADLRFFLCYFLKSVCAITLMTRLFFFVMLIEFTAAHTPNGCIMVTGSLQCLPAESTSDPFRAPLAQLQRLCNAATRAARPPPSTEGEVLGKRCLHQTMVHGHQN